MFRYFPTDLEGEECAELWSCVLSVLNNGVRNGGGIGDTLQDYKIKSHGSYELCTILCSLQL